MTADRTEERLELLGGPHRELRPLDPGRADGGDRVVIDHPESYRVSQGPVQYRVHVGHRLGRQRAVTGK
jgi:hypothetical protein